MPQIMPLFMSMIWVVPRGWMLPRMRRRSTSALCLAVFAGASTPHLLSGLLPIFLPTPSTSGWCWRVHPENDKVLVNKDTPDYTLMGNEDCCNLTADPRGERRTHTCYDVGECAGYTSDGDNALKDFAKDDPNRPAPCKGAASAAAGRYDFPCLVYLLALLMNHNFSGQAATSVVFLILIPASSWTGYKEQSFAGRVGDEDS